MPLYQFECPKGHTFDEIVPMRERYYPIMCTGDGCQEVARMVIAHSNPGGLLDHGLARNRDLAREGRWNPDEPSPRFMSKGSKWRK